MNVFQLNYESRLKSWYDLRKSLENNDIATVCLAIDKWWQYAPLLNHHLHPDDIDSWPGPWELLVENNYCQIARGLGMVYTLQLVGIKDVDFSTAIDDNNEECALVMVDNAKYILNYYPNTVISNSLQDFKLGNPMSMDIINKKI
ncbi:MAG: hypothetical protein WCK03_04745 [Candidatus Taylorbacteria bacterium]